MMSKDTKRTLFIYKPYECTAVEEYLEQMAEKGWLLQSVKRALFKFKKIEPQKIKYSVDVLNKVSIFDHEDSDVALEYREYCQAAGWNYVCQTGKIQIFYTEHSKEIISIHTDEEEKFKSVFKASVYEVGSQIFLIIALIFNLYILLFMGNADFVLASNLMISGIVTIISTIFINIIQVISFFIWVIKAKGKLKENKFMPYNSYKQLSIKNISIKAYILIVLFLPLAFSNFNNSDITGFNISLLIICTTIIIMSCVQRFINRKKYSKNTNMVIIVGSTLVSIQLILMLTGGIVFSSINKTDQREVPTEKVSLTLMDFGYKENEDKSPCIGFDKSILAQKIEYSNSSEDNNLTYSTLESHYPWVIKLDENRLLSGLNRHGIDLKQDNTKLPSNIKVYSDSKRRSFVLVSEHKVVYITKGFSYISDDEFLDKVYKKIFY